MGYNSDGLLRRRHLRPRVMRAGLSPSQSALERAVDDRLSTPQLLIHAADKALYAAKHAGRNCVRVFNPKPAGTTT